MSFYKEGTPNKITNVTNSDAQFNKLRERIASENNLIRCPSCDHLLAKKSADGALDIQHKKLNVVAASHNGMQMRCPVCQAVTPL